MKLTAITCTYQRPAAFRLCEAMLKRQTIQPDQWLILDGPDRMQKKVLDAIEAGKIEGDAIAFIEDDDWYRPTWLDFATTKLAKGYELVGEGNAAYYHVRNRWYSHCGNVRHAALCQTALHRDMLEPLANVIKSYDWPFFDVRIWNVECQKYLFLPKTSAERHVVGIKGILGEGAKFGYSGEHRDVLPKGTRSDPAMMELWKWIGPDAKNYATFRAS